MVAGEMLTVGVRCGEMAAEKCGTTRVRGRAERLRKTRYVIGEYERWGTRCGEINVMRGEWRAYGHATEYVESARARERQADAQ